MATHKHKGGPAPVPPGNQPQGGPQGGQTGGLPPEQESTQTGDYAGAPPNEQDPQRRLGNFESAGEHSYVQPGGRNDSHGRPTSGSGK